MMNSIDIGRLYENVLINDMRLYNINEQEVKIKIESMKDVYSGEASCLNTEQNQIADYTDPGHRCAYLQEYAALHTVMVRDMLSEAVGQNFNLFRQLVFSGQQIKICSLGGGPGTDVIGALSALHAAYGYFESSATVIDEHWCLSFDSILKELGTGLYGAFGNNISKYFIWKYVGANLLNHFTKEIVEDLSTASLVTMIKFTSTAACKDAYCTIKNIFTIMKPGALLLFIDNDSGGFHYLIENAETIFGPFKHEFSQDENIYAVIFMKQKFVSPREEIPQSPTALMPSSLQFNTFQPWSAQPKAAKRAHMRDSLKIRHFRHHVGNKLNMVIARARVLFMLKKNKYTISSL